MSKKILPQGSNAEHKKNKTLILLTDKAQAALGKLKCWHCEKWTKQLGTNAVMIVAETPVVLSFCKPCANIYKTASPLARHDFESKTLKNLTTSLAGKIFKPIDESEA